MNEELQADHRHMVAKLAKPGQDILDSCTARKMHLMHMVIGVTDEFFEWECRTGRDNALEELGDLLFYTEGLSFVAPDDLKATSIVYHQGILMCGLQRLAKRHVFYEQDLDCELLSKCYYGLLHWIEMRAREHGFNMRQVREANMNKLALRYPNFEYSDQRAKQRADKQDEQGTD